MLPTDTSRFRTHNFCFAADRRKTSPHKEIWKAFWNLESGIWENFACGIQNPGKFCLWNSEYSTRNPEIRLRFQNPESRIQVLLTKSGIQFLESGIHGVESRIKTILDSLWGERQPEHCFLVMPVLRDCYTRYFFV